MGLGFAAELADGRSAAVAAVRLDVDLRGVTIVDAGSGELRATWPFDGLLVEDLHGVSHLRHPSAPTTMAICRDGALLAELARWNVIPRGLPRGGRLARLLAVYAVALGVIIAAGYAAVPGVARVLAARVPLRVEERLGAEAETLLAASRCQDPAAQAALERLSKRLEAAAPGVHNRATWAS